MISCEARNICRKQIIPSTPYPNAGIPVLHQVVVDARLGEGGGVYQIEVVAPREVEGLKVQEHIQGISSGSQEVS